LIENRQALAKFHKSKSARLALGALEYAMRSVEPAALVRRAVRPGKSLAVRDVNGRTISLGKFDNIYVVGAGKAAAGMADALAFIVQVSEGAITAPYGSKLRSKAISLTEASHPVPDRAGVAGARKIIELAEKARVGDLLFVLISGGGSALMPLPAQGVTLSDKQKVTAALLRSGASIQEINAVRKHLSAIKGGQLLRHVDRSCRVVSLILSDVIGDDMEAIASGPTAPDSSTFAGAQRIMKKYRIANAAAKAHIAKGVRGEISDTPKPGDPVFASVSNVLIGSNSVACNGAVDYLRRKGLRAAHLGSEFDGEARDFGTLLARLALDLGRSGKPFAAVAGGETTVRLGKKSGVGGRNQEAALSCAASLKNDVVVACMGTDGIDGNSDAAGAIVSQRTIMQTWKKKVDLGKYLARHDSYHALKELDSLIFTGRTGTNVNDIAIIIGQGAKISKHRPYARGK
jgi:glycerate 2-kinase